MKSNSIDPNALNMAISLVEAGYEKYGEDIDLENNYWDLLDKIKVSRSNAIEAGKSYLSNAKPQLRFFGISLLAEICNPVETGEESDAEDIANALVVLSKHEDSALCQGAIADALSKTKSSNAVPVILKYSHSTNEDVRLSATQAIGTAEIGADIEEVSKRLIELSTDEYERVRDWATMWLGSRDDTPAIHLALIERLNDEDNDVVMEAIAALAERGDKKALPYLQKQLSSEETGPKIIEAAGVFALPELSEYLEGWSNFGFLHEWASKRCSADPKIRDSVDDEWLGEKWYLNVLHGVRRPIKFKESDHL